MARKEIEQFAEIMERSLRNNDYKGGWLGVPTKDLLSMLQQEVNELRDAIREKESRIIIQQEAADVANFAMMISDKLQGGDGDGDG